MEHPFATLKGEYEELLTKMVIERTDEVDRTARDLLRNKTRYQEIEKLTGVPAVWIAATHLRESGADWKTNLAQGDPLTRPSTHVPKGRPPLGPAPNDHFPVSFEYAAADALQYDRIDDITAPWTMPYALYKWERYNGWGYRDYHSILSPYLFAGTSLYSKGKYAADGKWDPNLRDKQLGVVPVAVRMMQMDAELSFDQLPNIGADTGEVAPPTPSPLKPEERSVQWLQQMLNVLATQGAFSSEVIPLKDDGNYGRKTTTAVWAFQQAYGIKVDGKAGPQTYDTIEKALDGLSPPHPIPPDALALQIINALKLRGDPILPLTNVYIDGMDPDGRFNGNRPNIWNDTNFGIDTRGASPRFLWRFEATDQPGRYWTENPMNEGGAAIIALGHHDVWTPGEYHGVPAWLQDQPIKYYRDKNKTFRREGNVHEGVIGVHQHQGYNYPHDDINRAAAGCLVRRLRNDHLKFMEFTRANGQRRLPTSIIAAEDVLRT